MAILPSLADAPNTLREYETIYILKPDTINEQVADVNGRVKAIIEERGGQILGVDNWGKRKLAYEIKKERKGIYLFWQYLGNAEIVAEFERNMRMLDPVMRYITIKLDTNVAVGGRESEVNDETFELAATTAADEEEIVTGRGAAVEASSGDADEASADDADASADDASADKADEASADEADEASADKADEASAEGDSKEEGN